MAPTRCRPLSAVYTMVAPPSVETDSPTGCVSSGLTRSSGANQVETMWLSTSRARITALPKSATSKMRL